MEKEVREFDVPYEIDWNLTVPIDNVIKEAIEAKELGATHLFFDIYQNYDVPYLKIRAYDIRMETDEEFSLRVQQEEARKEAIKQQELKQLEVLKAKYEQP